jgi:hypothetical protein
MNLKGSLHSIVEALFNPSVHLAKVVEAEQLDPFLKRELPAVIFVALLVGSFQGGFSLVTFLGLALALLVAPLLLIGALVVIRVVVLKKEAGSTTALLALGAVLALHISVSFLIGNFFGAQLAILSFWVLSAIFFIAWAPLSTNPVTAPKWVTMTVAVIIGTLWAGGLSDSPPSASLGQIGSSYSASTSPGDPPRPLESYSESIQACVQAPENCGGLSGQEILIATELQRREAQKFEMMRGISNANNKLIDNIIDNLHDMSRNRDDDNRR